MIIWGSNQDNINVFGSFYLYAKQVKNILTTEINFALNFGVCGGGGGGEREDNDDDEVNTTVVVRTHTSVTPYRSAKPTHNPVQADDRFLN